MLIRKVGNLFAAIILAMFVLAFAGCEEKDYYDPTYRPPGHVGDDPSTMDFSTTQKVVFNLKYDVPGIVSTFQVFSQNPFARNAMGGWDMRSDIQPISAGIDVSGTTEIIRTLPDYVTDLYLYSPSLFAPTLMHAKIDNGRAEFKEFGLNMPVSEEVGSTRTIGTRAFDHYLTGKSLSSVYEGAGLYYYRPGESYILKEEFPAVVRNAIANAFPNGEKTDPKYYTDASVYIQSDGGTGEGAELWLSVISAQAQFNNSLAYFCYDGPKENLARMTQAERNQFYVICAFQFAKSSPTMHGALRPGEYVKLKYYNKATSKFEDKFPVGTTVGWVLSANGFTGSKSNYYTQDRTADYPWYYSIPAWNPEMNANKKDHTIIFTARNGDEEYICFGFEDNNNEYIRGDGDCNDVIFHVKTNPANAIISPPEIPEEGVVEQAQDQYGYLAFEDNWPKKGDYDLNDVVVKYESTVTYAQRIGNVMPAAARVSLPSNVPYVKRVEDKFSIVHAGADFENAFAYKVNISPQRLTKITVDNVPWNVVPDGEGFLVELCPNVNEVIVPYKYGATPKDYNIVMEFSSEQGTCITEYEFYKYELYPPYNPYISPKAGVEVHLPMYRPTSKATESLFGTEDDRSQGDLWYVSGDKNNYPFAIHLAGVNNFVIPVETESIDKTYPRFINWVETGKKQDKDWYLYPKSK